MTEAAITNIEDARRRPGKSLSLDIEHVSHAYPLADDELPVLDDVTLHLEAGSFTALIGPSGCGQSTLLRLAAGLDRPTSGTIRAGGLPVEAPHYSRTLMFQDATLFPWRTVWKNVATGLESRGVLGREFGKVDEALSLVRLADFARAYPHQLSGGMAQRAALARALVNEPALLLLDEPLGKLDSLTRMALQDELSALWRRVGFTALLVTHDIEEALLLANRIVVFSDRPARIKTEVRIDKPYPRHRDDPEIVALRRTVLSVLGIEA
jgi:NitT/TauT family transport system ATP-binding protein